MKKIKLLIIFVSPLFLILLFFVFFTLSSYLKIPQPKPPQPISPQTSSPESTERKPAEFIIQEKGNSEKLADGLYFQKIYLLDQANPQEERKIQLNLLKINPQKRKFKLLINPDLKKSLKDIFLANNCLAGTNGMFFTKENTLIGLLVENSKIVHPFQKSRLTTGIFYLDQQQNPHIVSASSFTNFNQPFALQSGPIILFSNGETEIKSDDQKKVSRTFIAVDKNKQTYLCVVKDESGLFTHGLSLFEAQKIFSNQSLNFGVNFLAVLNLDGGTSSALFTPNLYLKEEKFTQNGICLL